ncbi:MAG TPA: hypothetical protein VLC95_16800 [Anaerolineae bacterium]|nr:hypothetical protein [Anaerolineae bacterium]
MPTLLPAVGPNGTDVRTAVLTVIPPPGLLGTNCHIDLLAYINGQLIGGVRKIDRPPTAPPIDEPPWAEREITVSPDPPLVGQPAQVCVELVNPTPVDQVVDVTFAWADLGAGVDFTDWQTVNGHRHPGDGQADHLRAMDACAQRAHCTAACGCRSTRKVITTSFRSATSTWCPSRSVSSRCRVGSSTCRHSCSGTRAPIPRLSSSTWCRSAWPG